MLCSSELPSVESQAQCRFLDFSGNILHFVNSNYRPQIDKFNHLAPPPLDIANWFAWSRGALDQICLSLSRSNVANWHQV